MKPWNQATMVHFSPWLQQNQSLYNKPTQKKSTKKALHLDGKASEDVRHPQSSKTPVTLSSLSFLWVHINTSIYLKFYQCWSQYIHALTLPWDTATAVSIRKDGFMGNQRTGWPGNFDTGYLMQTRRFSRAARKQGFLPCVRDTSATNRLLVSLKKPTLQASLSKARGNGREATGE